MSRVLASAPATGRLAVIGGFVKPPAAAPHGSWQAAFRLCNAIARTGRWQGIDVFHEDIERPRPGHQVVLPPGLPSRLLERTRLPGCAGAYATIYVANGDQMYYAPHVLRPPGDPVPVICEIGTAHHAGQWTNLHLAAQGGALRSSDGFIFKARAVETLYRQIWQDWSLPAETSLPFPQTTVIPNGVDLSANTRSERLRAETRQQLGLAPDQVAFLTFSRLSAGTKGDYRALLFSFGRVVARWPGAVLVLSGKTIDPRFLQSLRSDIRQAGLGNNVLVVDDPYLLWPDARQRLMSAADVFVHLSTGAEEVCPQSPLEAMAFGLPILASHWSGLPEIVAHGENGFLLPTLVAEPPAAVQQTLLARDEARVNADLGQCVGCDGEAFVRAAATLLGDEATRLAMGRQSRRRAEAHFDLDEVAARRVSFFDRLSHDARQAQAPRPLRPLVNLRRVLHALGTRALADDDVVTVAWPEGFTRLRAAPPLDDAAPANLVELIECVLAEIAPLTVGALVDRVANIVGPAEDPQDEDEARAQLSSACGRALVRLVAYGAIRVMPG